MNRAKLGQACRFELHGDTKRLWVSTVGKQTTHLKANFTFIHCFYLMHNNTNIHILFFAAKLGIYNTK